MFRIYATSIFLAAIINVFLRRPRVMLPMCVYVIAIIRVADYSITYFLNRIQQSHIFHLRNSQLCVYVMYNYYTKHPKTTNIVKGLAGTTYCLISRVDQYSSWPNKFHDNLKIRFGGSRAHKPTIMSTDVIINIFYHAYSYNIRTLRDLTMEHLIEDLRS